MDPNSSTPQNENQFNGVQVDQPNKTSIPPPPPPPSPYVFGNVILDAVPITIIPYTGDDDDPQPPPPQQQQTPPPPQQQQTPPPPQQQQTPPPPPPQQQQQTPPQQQPQQENPLEPRFAAGEPFGLPKGWVIEHRPRSSAKYIGKVDQFFHEPAADEDKKKKRFKRTFRSVREVEEYLGISLTDIKKKPGRPKQTDPSKASAGSSSSKPRGRKRKLPFDFSNPPEKVSWDFIDGGEDYWPSVDGAKVPAPVREEWIETRNAISYAKDTFE